jgi:Domain of unknown function (DUF4383)
MPVSCHTGDQAAKEVRNTMAASASGRSAATPVQRFAQILGAVYLLVGLLGFAFTGFANFAGTVSILIGAVYLVVGILGLFTNGDSDLNLLNINQPDNALHLASAALGLYFGLAGRRRVASTA